MRCAPPESAVRTERRKGRAEIKVLAAAGTIEAPALAERANRGAIGSPGMLCDAVGRARIFLVAIGSVGDWGSAIGPVTWRQIYVEFGAEAEKGGLKARSCPHAWS